MGSDRVRCKARSKQTGEPCKKYPVPGGQVCRYHGGRAPQVATAAKRRAAELEAHAEAERMLAAAGVDADPIEHLLDSLHRIAALAAVYGQMVAGLDAASEERGGLRGKLGYVEADPDDRDELRVTANDELLGLDRHGAAQLHPFVVECHRLLEQRAKLAKLAIDAGVAERQVRLAEQQGQVIVTVVRRSLEVLGVEVTEQVTRVVAGELRAIAG